VTEFVYKRQGPATLCTILRANVSFASFCIAEVSFANAGATLQHFKGRPAGYGSAAAHAQV
jgi:hypothetical protein